MALDLGCPADISVEDLQAYTESNIAYFDVVDVLDLLLSKLAQQGLLKACEALKLK